MLCLRCIWPRRRQRLCIGFVGEGVKILVAIVAAVIVWRQFGSQIQPIAYWAGLIVVLKAHNFGLLRTVKE